MKIPDDLPPYVECVLAYDHTYRKIYATSVYKSAAGKWLVTGWDPDANDGEGGFRSFRADRIQGNIHLLKE